MKAQLSEKEEYSAIYFILKLIYINKDLKMTEIVMDFDFLMSK
jgi:hypothetical protein